MTGRRPRSRKWSICRRGRTGPHAVMNYQSKEQLDIEFVLNVSARIIDSHTVEVQVGLRARAWSGLGSEPIRLDVPGAISTASTTTRLGWGAHREPGDTGLSSGAARRQSNTGCFFNATRRRVICWSATAFLN